MNVDQIYFGLLNLKLNFCIGPIIAIMTLKIKWLLSHLLMYSSLGPVIIIFLMVMF